MHPPVQHAVAASPHHLGPVPSGRTRRPRAGPGRRTAFHLQAAGAHGPRRAPGRRERGARARLPGALRARTREKRRRGAALSEKNRARPDAPHARPRRPCCSATCTTARATFPKQHHELHTLSNPATFHFACSRGGPPARMRSEPGRSSGAVLLRRERTAEQSYSPVARLHRAAKFPDPDARPQLPVSTARRPGDNQMTSFKPIRRFLLLARVAAAMD